MFSISSRAAMPPRPALRIPVVGVPGVRDHWYELRAVLAGAAAETGFPSLGLGSLGPSAPRPRGPSAPRPPPRPLDLGSDPPPLP